MGSLMQVGGPPKPGEPTDLQQTNPPKMNIVFSIFLIFVIRHLRVDQPPKPGEPKDTNIKEYKQKQRSCPMQVDGPPKPGEPTDLQKTKKNRVSRRI
jgi:hypothetical protein